MAMTIEPPIDTYENVDDFITAFDENILIKEMRRYAKKHHIPVITPSLGHFLRLLTTLQAPTQVLELGTAIGVSTLTMAEKLMPNARIKSVELNERRFQLAQSYIERSPDAGKIQLYLDDFRAPDFFQRISSDVSAYDMVFVDASKGQYQETLEKLYPMVQENGLIVFDDVFLQGRVLKMTWTHHRQKTATVRMHAFLHALKTDRRFLTSIIAVDDGMVVLKKQKELS